MGVRIVELPDGRVLVDIRAATPSGERVRERHKFEAGRKAATKRWADERYDHLRLHGKEKPKKAASEVPVREVPTIAEFKKRFFAGHVEANRLKRGTVDSYESHYRNQLVPFLGTKRLDEISHEDVQALKRSMDKLSPKTVNNVLGTLSKTLNVAVEWGVIDELPCKVDPVKVPPTEMEWYDESDLERLIAAARRVGPEAELIVLLGCDAGLRLSEILALEWSDVRQGVASIRRREYLGSISGPKSNRVRSVELTERLQTAIAKAKHLRGDRLLYQEDGKSATSKWVKAKVKAAERLAGLEARGRVHILRHTFCSRLAIVRVPPPAIQRLAGHASITTTMRYMHLAPSAGADAIRLLERGTAGARGALGDVKEEGAVSTAPSKSSS